MSEPGHPCRKKSRNNPLNAALNALDITGHLTPTGSCVAYLTTLSHAAGRAPDLMQRRTQRRASQRTPRRTPRRTGHRSGTAAVVTAAVVMALGAPGAAVALPAGAPAAATQFASSFESGDPSPDWTDTVDTDATGAPRAAGVDGGYRTGIPGNVTDHVTDVRASGENTGAGEVKENLVDGEPGTKWLTFEPAGWVEFDLAKPVKLVTYALTSANDYAERDPRDWT